MWKPTTSVLLVGPLLGLMVLQLVPNPPQPHVHSKQIKMGVPWTTYEVGTLALDRRMALVVSDVVGGKHGSGFSTRTAASRISFWEQVDLATVEDIRASMLDHTAGHNTGKDNNNNNNNNRNNNRNRGRFSSNHNNLPMFARTDDAALTCSTPETAGGKGLATCIGQCENRRSFLRNKSPREGACHLLCALAVAPCVKDASWEGWISKGSAKMEATIDLVVPPAYSTMVWDMARDTILPALNTSYQACLSASASATTAAKTAVAWLKNTFYPWACSAAADIADTADVATINAVSLSQAAFRSSSAGLSAALELALDLSGSAAVGATEVATATAASLEAGAAAVLGAATNAFWWSPLGNMVTVHVTPLLEEGKTAAFLHAASAFWAWRAMEMEAARVVVVPLVERGAATVVKAVFRLWRSALVEAGKSLVKTHLLDDTLVSVLLLLLAVRGACHFHKLRKARACKNGLAKEEETEWQQADDLMITYADNFRKRKGQQKVVRRLRDRVAEATRQAFREAERETHREMGCLLLARSLSNAKNTTVAVRFARWKAEAVGLEKAAGVGMDGGGSGTNGGAAQGNRGSGACGVAAAPSGGNPARVHGSAEPRRASGRSWRTMAWFR